jgi:hypothetical protein
LQRQRGLWTYFVEDLDVFDEARDVSYPKLSERDPSEPRPAGSLPAVHGHVIPRGSRLAQNVTHMTLRHLHENSAHRRLVSASSLMTRSSSRRSVKANQTWHRPTKKTDPVAMPASCRGGRLNAPFGTIATASIDA